MEASTRPRNWLRLLLPLVLVVQWTGLAADYSTDVELAQYSNLACGRSIRNNRVLLIDLQSWLEDKWEAVARVNERVPDHGLESPVPVLIEKVYMDGKISQGSLQRDAVRESATRGCDLVILLDTEIVEKVLYRQGVLDAKFPVGYILVLFGSQVKNSTRRSAR